MLKVKFNELLTNHNHIKYMSKPLLLFSDGNALRDSDIFDKHSHLLTSSLRNQIKKYYQWEDQKNFLVGKLLTYLIYYLITGEIINFDDLKKNKFGKPYIDRSRVKFNISHSASMVVCFANLDNEIGIDIEKVESVNLTDFTNHFKKSELDLVDHFGLEFFFKLWTTKESIIKCLGEGITTIKLNDIEIDNFEKGYVGQKKFYIKQSRFEDYIFSISSQNIIKDYSIINVLF